MPYKLQSYAVKQFVQFLNDNLDEQVRHELATNNNRLPILGSRIGDLSDVYKTHEAAIWEIISENIPDNDTQAITDSLIVNFDMNDLKIMWRQPTIGYLCYAVWKVINKNGQ